MKMIFAMLHSEDVDETVEELNKEKYWVTKLSTTGGFLKNKNVTLVIGTEDEQVPGRYAGRRMFRLCSGCGSVREILRLDAGRCGRSECPTLAAESCEPMLYAIRMR